MKIKSICVVETSAEGDPTIHTFTADQTGRQQAHALFRDIAREQKAPDERESLIRDFSDEEIEEALATGHGLSDEDGEYTLQVIESEWRAV